jgi:G:T-mismatch repair DNA endonuclease (very short patch repair protein)
MQAEEFFADLADKVKLDAMYKPHSKEFFIRKNETVVYRYDFTVLSLKKIIEFNGSYWHANPKMYPADFVVFNMTAQEIWDRDEDKRKLAEQQGFEVLIVWDDMPYKDALQLCLNFLRKE